MFGQEPLERERTYDVQNIKIEVKLDLKAKMVDGRVTTEVRPLVDNMEAFTVDAVGMNIKSVKGWYHVTTDNPQEAEKYEDIKFEYDKKQITVHPRTGIKKNFPFKYQVEYSTTDPEKGLYFIQPDSVFPNKRYEVWTQGEGEDNRYWFPCYDYPNDKAITEVIITTDSKFSTLSNGKLLSVKDNKDSTKTWDWRLPFIHSSYLVMLAVGNYDEIQSKYLEIPITTYVPTGRRSDGIRSYTETDDILKFFSEKIRYKYPWETYSQVVVQDYIYGGMENTGAVVYFDGSLYDESVPPDYNATGLAAHEIAHMWWGDNVTCKNWNEIWLNEGFATYFEAMYKEYSQGKDEFDYAMLRRQDEVIEADSLQRVPVYARNGLTVNTYSKGAIVLNMLRNIMSDGLFIESLNNYLTKHEYGNVTTKDLIDELTAVYNKPDVDVPPRDFKAFFDEWIYKAGIPEYNVSYDYSASSNQLSLKVQQVQNLPDSMTFTTPVNVQIITENSRWTQTIKPTREPLVFQQSLDSRLLNIIFNIDRIVLCKINFQKPKEDWLYQLNNSAEAIERIDAVRGLRTFWKDENIVEALNNKLKSDGFWGVRYEIANTLVDSGSANVPNILMSAFENELDSRVRRSCLNAIAEYYTKHPDSVNKNVLIDFISNKIKTDKSYYVTADGISAISKIADKEKIYDLVSGYINKDSHVDIIRRSVLEALTISKDVRAKDIFKLYAVKGSTSRVRNLAITGLADYLDDESVVKLLTDKLSEHNRGVKFRVISVLEQSNSPLVKTKLQELLAKTNDNALVKAINEVLDKR
jgi:aminopeptidase N